MENRAIKILGIDDNRDNLIILEALIKDTFPDYTFFKADNGVKGLQIACSENPDVILLDIVMPDMDGFEVCKTIKSDEQLKDIPVVFITALKEDRESRMKALEVGAEAFIAKPIDEIELVTQIRAMVKIKTASIDKKSEKNLLLKKLEQQNAELRSVNNATLNLMEDIQKEILARKKSEEELKKSEEKYRLLIEQSPDAILVHLNGIVQFANAATVKLFEAANENELIGLNLIDFVHPDHKMMVANRMKDVALKNSPLPPLEEKLFTLKGNIFYAEVTSLPIQLMDGTGAQVVARDITDKKKAQDALIESEKSYRTLFEISPTGITILDKNGNILDVNDEVSKATQYSKNELIGNNISIFIPKHRKNDPTEDIAKIFKLGHLEHEVDSVRKDGSIAYVLLRETVITLANGEQGILSVSSDITSRKNAEDEIKKISRHFQALTEKAPDGIALLDKEGNFKYISPSGEKAFGFKVTAKPPHPNELTHPDDINHVLFALSEIIKNPAYVPIIQYRFKTNKGEWKWLESTFSNLLDDPDVASIVVNFRDISERKVIEKELLEHRDLLQKMLVESTQFIESVDNKVDYQQMTDFIKVISGAKYTAFNLFDEDGLDFTTLAFSGLSNFQSKATSILGFDLINKKWKHDARRQAKIKNNTFTKFDNLHELTGIVIAKSVSSVIEKTFNLGEVYIIQISKNEKSIGDFTLMFERNQTLKNKEIIEIFVNQIGLFLSRKKTEADLEESREKFKGLSDAAFESIFFSEKGICIEQNKAAERTFGYTDEEAIGRYGTEWMHPDDRDMVMEKMLSMYTLPYEARAIKKDGTIFEALLQGKMMHYKGKDIRVTSLTDISDLKKAEKELKASEEKFRGIAENSSDLIAIADNNGMITYASPASESLFYLKPEEMVGKYFSDFVVDEQKSEAGFIFHNIILNNKSPKNVEFKMKRADGSNFYGEVNGSKFSVEEFNGVIVNIHDFSNRKLMMEALRTSEENYRKDFVLHKSILESPMEVIIFALDTNYCYTAFTKHHKESIKQLWGTHIEIGSYILDVITTKEDKEQAKRNFDRVLNDEFFVLTEEYGDINLQRIFFEDYYSPIKDESGNIVGISVFVLDVTKRMKALEDLKESEEKFRVMAEMLPQIVFETDIFGKLTYINKQAYSILGYTEEDDVIGLNTLDLYIPEDRQRAKDNVKNSLVGLNTGSNEYAMYRKDGSIINVLVYSDPMLKNNKIKGLRGIIIDISELKKAQNALRESEYFFKESQKAANVGSYKTNFVNSTWESSEVLNQIFGIDTEYHRNIEGWLDIVHIEDREMMRQYLTNEVVIGKKEFDKEYRISRKSDQKTRWVHGLGKLTFDENGNTISMTGTIMDITESYLSKLAIEESEEKYRTIFENVQDVFYQTNMNGIILEISPSIKHFTEFDREKLLNTNVSELYTHRKDRDLFLNAIKQKGEVNDYEISLKTSSGRTVYASINAKLIFDRHNNPIRIDGSLRDITARKIALESLKESEVKYRLMFDNNPQPMIIYDIQDLSILEINSAAMHQYGYSREEFLALNLSDLHLTEDLESLVQDIEKSKFEYNPGGVWRNVRKDKEILWVETNSHSVVFVGRNARHVMIKDITQRMIAEAELSKQKHFFEQMFMQSSVSTQIFDADGWCEKINPKYTETFGIEINNDESAAYNILNDAHVKSNGTLPYLEKVFRNGETAEWEFSLLRTNPKTPKKKEKVWFQNWAYPIFDENQSLSNVIIQHNNITDRIQALYKLHQSEEQLKKFAAHLQNVREEERVNLAREIHDELGQILVAMKFDAGVIKQRGKKLANQDDSQHITENSNHLIELIDKTITTTKKVLTELRPEVLEMLGFIDAVKSYIKDFEIRFPMKCKVDIGIQKLEVSQQFSVALYRIFQETITNIIKYAQASEIQIHINVKNGKFYMEISDNGVGFDPKLKVKESSFGLIGMKERSYLLGGELTITSKLGKGTKVKIEIPYSL